MLAKEAGASMHQTDAGINDEALLAQDSQPEKGAEIEQQMLNEQEVTKEFADWMLDEVICNSVDADADIHEGGYEEPRTSPTREPSSGWPDISPQSIRDAAAAVTDPDVKEHSEIVQEVWEEVHQRFRCVTCKAEVEAQKDPHFCQTCQVSQCKTCIAGHWLEVDGTCALQVKMQKHQYKKVACEIAAEGIDHRRQNRAESASTANTHDQLKEYSKRIRDGDLVCYVVCHKQPLCKRSFWHSCRKWWAGDMQNCSVCHAYCHKGCGTIPEGEENFRYGYANFKCPKCAEIEPTVQPPWKRSTARDKGVKGSSCVARRATTNTTALLNPIRATISWRQLHVSEQ
jgi:hypothetical protein